MTDLPEAAPMQGSTQDYCDRFPDDGHHWESRTRGGEPIWVRSCTFCRYIDWDGLREQAEATRADERARVLDEFQAVFQELDLNDLEVTHFRQRLGMTE